MLSEVTATPAAAATQGTTVESGAVAPAVVGLTDAATIAVDASLGNDFRVTIAGNRTLGNPANPTDGQKIVVQVTQGAGGPFTLSYGTAYEFSTGLPQPTLSTTAGTTDLLGFVYNAAKGKWLLRRVRDRLRLDDHAHPPTGTYRLFPSTNGPSTPVSYSGPFLAGVVFEVTTGGCWLDGYWWWVCPSGQPTAAQTFALWCIYGNDGLAGALSTVTSGALTAGQWNYVPLADAGAAGDRRLVQRGTGFTGSFPDTNDQFGTGEPYTAGITQRPADRLLRPVRVAAGAVQHRPGRVQRRRHRPHGATCRPTGPVLRNFWMDLQVDTDPPSGTSYRLWPSYPTLPGTVDRTPTGYTLAHGVPAVGSPARWTRSGSTPRPARARCRPGARSGTSARRPWSRAPTTPRRPGRARPGPAGSPAPTAASRCPPVTTRWRCSTAAGPVVPGHDRLLGRRRSRRQRHHRRPAHRAWRRPPRAPARAPTTRAPGPTRIPTGPAATARTSGSTSRSQPSSWAAAVPKHRQRKDRIAMRLWKGLLVGLVAVGLAGCSGTPRDRLRPTPTFLGHGDYRRGRRPVISDAGRGSHGGRSVLRFVLGKSVHGLVEPASSGREASGFKERLGKRAPGVPSAEGREAPGSSRR